MKKLAIVMLALFAGASGLAQPGEADFCKTFVEKNKTCEDVIFDKCSTTLREKMLEQIDAAPPDFQPQMRAELDGKLEMFCTGFVTQISGEKALDMCNSKATTTDPDEQAQMTKMRDCLAKSTCHEYADCAVEFN
jgi:hypothetical protein